MAEFAVVAGVGAAVVFGWGCGVASADEASESSASGSSESTGSSSAGSESSGPSSTGSGQRHGRDRDDDGPGDDAGVTEDAEELANDSDVGDRDGDHDAGVVDGDVLIDSAGLEDDGALAEAETDTETGTGIET
ncbi:MAG: hypothetical protein KAH46_18075, partial [Mycobacterium sp.]|nr:hypothetical protein [Mycobacterium sp.]